MKLKEAIFKRPNVTQKRIVLFPALFLSLIFAAILIASFTFYIVYKDRIYPGVWVGNMSLGGKTLGEATQLLSSATFRNPILVANIENQQSITIPLSGIDFEYQVGKTAENAYQVGRNARPLKDLQTLINLQEENLSLPFEYKISEEKLAQYISTFAGQVATEPILPSAKLVGEAIVVNRGKKGTDIDISNINKEVHNYLAFARSGEIKAEFINHDPSITSTQAEVYKKRAESLIDKSVKLTYENLTVEASDEELISMLGAAGGFNQSAVDAKVAEVAKIVNREPQNPTFVFEEGRVKEFAPSRDGLEVKTEELRTLITQSLEKMETSEEKQIPVSIAVVATAPKISTEEVNNLGIKQLIGRGTSRYRGSIASRVHNVALAASRLNGTLIAPGEIFSFNNAVGDVSKLTGYKEAYVIKEGKTVLGDGGGLCQVSTTIFRAALNAGLPITERRGHSYRVGYYEQDSGPGLDATVYSPTTDFKFTNDTPGHILVQAKADTKALTLEFELYGTSDGRVASVTKPVVYDVVAPPDDSYVDDPTIPSGQIKQIEHKAWGAKTRFDYEVKREEEVVYKKTFVTNYRPWQAVYLRGTGPVQ